MAASFAMASYSSWTCCGAGRGPGRAKGALMRAFSGADSFDISGDFSLLDIAQAEEPSVFVIMTMMHGDQSWGRADLLHLPGPKSSEARFEVRSRRMYTKQSHGRSDVNSIRTIMKMSSDKKIKEPFWLGYVCCHDCGNN
jgi:hypothetical protein